MKSHQIIRLGVLLALSLGSCKRQEGNTTGPPSTISQNRVADHKARHVFSSSLYMLLPEGASQPVSIADARFLGSITDVELEPLAKRFALDPTSNDEGESGTIQSLLADRDSVQPRDLDRRDRAGLSALLGRIPGITSNVESICIRSNSAGIVVRALAHVSNQPFHIYTIRKPDKPWKILFARPIEF